LISQEEPNSLSGPGWRVVLVKGKENTLLNPAGIDT